MEFVKWVGENVQPPRRVPESDLVGRTVRLREKDANIDMCVRVDDIPDSAVIVRPDRAGQWRVLNEGNAKKWDSLCDYLILWENSEKIFAVFVELKGTSPHSIGKIQLHWTLPMLYYLLYVFNADNSSVSVPLEQTVVSNFIEIGDKKSKRIAKRSVKPSPSPFFRVDRYKGIQVHYSVEKEFSLCQFLTD